MIIIKTLLFMIFMHIVDDYYLQGWLASAKQKSWWEKNAPEELYEYDYIWALIMHSFSWTFMIMLPIMYILRFKLNLSFFLVFILNIIAHARTDDLKANKKQINLIADQIIHIVQIIATWMIFV